MGHSCHGVSTGQHKTTEYAAHQCVGGIDTVFKSLNVMRGGIEAEQQSLGTHYQPFVSLKYMWCTLNVQGGELCTQQAKLRVEFVKGTIAGYARIGLDTRVPSGSEVVPASPVRVYIMSNGIS